MFGQSALEQTEQRSTRRTIAAGTKIRVKEYYTLSLDGSGTVHTL